MIFFLKRERESEERGEKRKKRKGKNKKTKNKKENKKRKKRTTEKKKSQTEPYITKMQKQQLYQDLPHINTQETKEKQKKRVY